MEKLEEPGIGLHPARDVQEGDRRGGPDRVQVEAPQPALEPAEGERAALGFALGERDALDLAVQRRAEADLVEAARDLLHGTRDAGAVLRLQPDDEDVARVALV